MVVVVGIMPGYCCVSEMWKYIKRKGEDMKTMGPSTAAKKEARHIQHCKKFFMVYICMTVVEASVASYQGGVNIVLGDLSPDILSSLTPCDAESFSQARCRITFKD